MADHVVLCRLVFVLFQKLSRSGKSDLSNVLLYFFCRHTNSVVNKLQRLFFRVYYYMNLRLVVLRKVVLAHHIQLFQLCDGVTSV